MSYGRRLASSVFVLFLWVMRNIVKDGALETYVGGIHLRMMLFSMKMCRDILGFLVLFPCLHQPILTVMCLRALLGTLLDFVQLLVVLLMRMFIYVNNAGLPVDVAVCLLLRMLWMGVP